MAEIAGIASPNHDKSVLFSRNSLRSPILGTWIVLTTVGTCDNLKSRIAALGQRLRIGCRRFVVIVVALGLAGCATIGRNSSDEEKRKAVNDAALARWALLIKGESGQAYDEFMSKGSRQVISRGEFVERMKITAFRTAAVEQIECGAESCQASVRITYDHKLMRGVGNTLRENWIIEDGKVWYVWSP